MDPVGYTLLSWAVLLGTVTTTLIALWMRRLLREVEDQIRSIRMVLQDLDRMMRVLRALARSTANRRGMEVAPRPDDPDGRK